MSHHCDDCFDSGEDCKDCDHVHVPKGPWIICPTCFGEGRHSRDLGAITQEDRERDWDPDEFDQYMAGDYDKTCMTCNGTGKIRQDDEDALQDHQRQIEAERGYNDAGERLW